jgi:hypothetical protein
MSRSNAASVAAEMSTAVPKRGIVLDPSVPVPGDVVIRPDAGGGFSVRQLPGEPQLSWRSRDEAIRCAFGFAERYRVNTWEERDQRVVLIPPQRRRGVLR